MDYRQHGQVVSFIWNIADDVLRGALNRTKYRDVILPMTVIRRLDALLEPTKEQVLQTWQLAEERSIGDQRHGLLMNAAKQPFYNTSQFTLRRLTDNPANIHANLLDYLDGFSPNVREILERFSFRGHLKDLNSSERLGLLIEKFTTPAINLSPTPHNGLPGLDNHAMGTVFEELLRRFNEQNNEEAGEHFTPRDVVNLMADLTVAPIADKLGDGVYLVYDGACGTGGMLSVSEQRIREIARRNNGTPSVYVYGQELNPETWAIAQADQLVQAQPADNIKLGSTIGDDQFPTMKFEFMISNPPYGVSWKADMDKLGGKSKITDPRFIIQHNGDPEYSLLTRSSDGQLLFLANMLAKMKHDTELGSRIAEIHNGSSLFTGDAGQGESNIRRWIIENDWLEAIIALPNNMFYNTGIATYIWVLTNRKEERRRGKVQLIDATKRFTPRRKNLGAKNADLSDADQRAILDEFLAFEESETSKIFPNEAFGYWKVTVDRPLRLKVKLTQNNIDALRESGRDDELADAMERLLERTRGDDERLGYSQVPISLDLPSRWSAKRERIYREFFCERDEGGEPVVKTYLDERLTDDLGRESWDPNDIALERRLQGVGIWCPPVPYGVIAENPFPALVTFEADPELRDTEQILLTEPGGIAGFMGREVLPYAPDAWVVEGSEKIGYEISFTRYFYRLQQLRTLTEIEADIRALEEETEGLLEEILVTVES